MKLIKISPKFQITIPRSLRRLCSSGWFSVTSDGNVITLRPIEIQEAQSQEEIMEELLDFAKNAG